MRFLYCSIVPIVVSGVANAAPWTQDAGNIYARASLASETLDGVSARRADVYGEYGVAERWTVTAKSEAVQFDDFSDFDREAYRATVRHRLWAKDGWLVSTEAGAVYGTTAAGIFGCDEWGAEARLSGGLSGRRANRNFYAFADVAVISYEDGCQRQRAEFGYGSQVYGRVNISQQVWLEQGNDSADSQKFETILSYQFDGFELGAGYREEFGNDFDEQSWLVTVTVRR